MQNYFYSLANQLIAGLANDEVLLLNFDGESSDFVRLNHNRVRQVGSVTRRSISLELIVGGRHATARTELSGSAAIDLAPSQALLGRLRMQLQHLPEDPYLHYATEVSTSEHHYGGELPSSGEALACILAAAESLDLVGVWASGDLYTGFANSLGQRNWHSSTTFHFDWSLYHTKDKAVKASYAGFAWDPSRLETLMAGARNDLGVMQRTAKTITPGRYRVYLAPAAMQEVMDLMAWDGYSLKSHRTRQTPLIKMLTEHRQLNPAVSIVEHHARGLVPSFTDTGFIKPDAVRLVDHGTYRDCLISPRSAREFGANVNASTEFPYSLALASGGLAKADILGTLDTGLLINNLWYGNFSDRTDCRITGMTRFACFWVEDGTIQVPVNVMRFDESVYHLLGDRLLALTQERELILDNSTYGGRSNRSYLLPGALVDGLTFTL